METDTSSSLRSCYRYIPEFIAEEEETYILRKISETPQPKWKNVTKRRLQIWGGELTPGNALIQQPLPPFLNSYPDLIGRLADTGAFVNSAHKAPNHVIINEYKPGDGIMPHEDGPSYHPVVATISLGSHTVFHYYRYKPTEEDPEPTSPNQLTNGDSTATAESKVSTDAPPQLMSSSGKAIDPVPVLSLLLEPRSVIITSGTLYKDHLHCIQELTEDIIEGSRTASDNADGDEMAGSNPQRGRHGFEGGGGVRIDNWEQLLDSSIRKVAIDGGVLQRETRVSLTCRDVEKVRKIGLMGAARR
ncbi:hypothetical protein CPB86DRAFT_731016 [Serendipita vermifera]|nr:hypothetical protein CPB86DRAFT_731016 [Serendipita vermifera]